MISYLSVDRIEGPYAVCEVENISVEDSKQENFDIECFMCDIEREMFFIKGYCPEQGEVYTVSHEGENIKEILCIARNEARRRIEFNSQI